MEQTIFNQLIWAWILTGMLTMVLLLFVTAPYGRHSKSNWGPMIGNRMGWLIMELPALIFPLGIFLSGEGSARWEIWLLFLPFLVHYTNRVLIFPFRLRTKGKKMPLLIVLMAIFFNAVNGFFIGYFWGYYSGGYGPSWFGSPQFITGLIIFCAGMAINIRSDNMLIWLRKTSSNGYSIPRGWLFRYISCPNHFGEMMEWTGYAILAWNMPALSFALWTFANLVPRALDHHKWYREHFSEYPKERKAVFPGIL
jgi:3-oxo-5-alpha-steroid 4-dehydrogenase 1